MIITIIIIITIILVNNSGLLPWGEDLDELDEGPSAGEAASPIHSSSLHSPIRDNADFGFGAMQPSKHLDRACCECSSYTVGFLCIC